MMVLFKNQKKLLWAGLTVVALVLLYATGCLIHNPMAVMVYALVVAGYGLLIAYCAAGPGGIRSVRELKSTLPYGSWVLIIVVAYILIVMAHEKFIYIWDYGWYHELSIVFSTNYLTDTPGSLELLYESINYSEYNYFLPLLLTFPLRLLGNSRLSYLLSVWICFGLPAGAILSYGIGRYVEALHLPSFFHDLHPMARKAIRGISFLLVSMWPWMLVPVMEGYIDIGALLTASCLIVLTLTRVDWKRFSWKTNTIIAVLLLIVIMQRRYFTIFAVGYVAGLMIHALTSWLIAPREERKQIFWTVFLSMLYIGSLCLAVLLLFFKPFFEMSLLRNYAVAYSAFSYGNLWGNLNDFINKQGYFWPLFTLASALFTIIRTKGKAPRTLFLLTSVIVTMFVFFQIQVMGYHHMYIIVAQMLLLLAGGIAQLCFLVQRHWKRIILGSLVAICCCATLLYSYGGYRYKHLRAFGTVVYSSRQRNDIEALKELDAQLCKLTKDDDRGVYMLADSGTLNSDVLRKLYFPPSTYPAYPMLTEGHLDLRDGFPTDFLSAGLIVLGHPGQYTSGDANRIVSVLQREVEDINSPIGMHFSLVGDPITIDGGITVYIYQKNSLFTEENIQYLQDMFDGFYPEYKEIFHDRIVYENQRT